jgi:hypothetical protein
MPRPEIVVHPRIRQQLGDDTIRLVLGHLAPGDYQTCNRPLGPQSRWKLPITSRKAFVQQVRSRPVLAAHVSRLVQPVCS